MPPRRLPSRPPPACMRPWKSTSPSPSLVSLIEPMLVVLLGVIVGTIVVSMFLPLVAMIESLKAGGSVKRVQGIQEPLQLVHPIA